MAEPKPIPAQLVSDLADATLKHLQFSRRIDRLKALAAADGIAPAALGEAVTAEIKRRSGTPKRKKPADGTAPRGAEGTPLGALMEKA